MLILASFNRVGSPSPPIHLAPALLRPGVNTVTDDGRLLETRRVRRVETATEAIQTEQGSQLHTNTGRTVSSRKRRRDMADPCAPSRVGRQQPGGCPAIAWVTFEWDSLWREHACGMFSFRKPCGQTWALFPSMADTSFL